MRGLIVLVLLAALGWSGYWWFASTAHENALRAWMNSQRAAGWTVEHDDLRVTGYPNRLDTHVGNLRIADPAAGWSWRAGQFQILSLSYKPNHIVAAWPGRQEISSRGNRYRVEGERIRASVILVPDTKLTLDRLTLEMLATTITGSDGSSTAIESGLISTRRSEMLDAPEYSYDLSVELDSVRFPEPAIRELGLAGLLPVNLSSVTSTVLLRFDEYWDRTTISPPPTLLGIDILDFDARWGDVRLTASGAVDITPDGLAEGDLTLDVRNWRLLVKAAKKAGTIDRETAQALGSALGLLDGLDGKPDRIQVPLTFRNGRAFVGPVDVGAAPLLVYRQ
ncbi:MAG: DUF2125 domain-containing protein [Paracoccaceae bacterium]